MRNPIEALVMNVEKESARHESQQVAIRNLWLNRQVSQDGNSQEIDLFHFARHSVGMSLGYQTSSSSYLHTLTQKVGCFSYPRALPVGESIGSRRWVKDCHQKQRAGVGKRPRTRHRPGQSSCASCRASRCGRPKGGRWFGSDPWT